MQRKPNVVKCNCGRRYVGNGREDVRSLALASDWDHVPGEGWACPPCQRDALASMAIDMGWTIQDTVDYVELPSRNADMPPVWAVYR